MKPLLLFAALGAVLPDRGLFPEFDPLVSLTLPADLATERLWLRADAQHGILTLYEGHEAIKAYPASIAFTPKPLTVPHHTTLAALPLTLALPLAGPGADATRPHPQTAQRGIRLRPADLDELRQRLGPQEPRTPVLLGAPGRSEDHDGDGIADRIDIALGARKLVHNRAAYLERYLTLPYPGGDVPRTEGVCSDTVIRALRNAGIDLQQAVHEDIMRSRAAYPMAPRVDASINHRRVKTLVRWFERHWQAVPEGAPLLPGDIVFFDTFPARSGPDHLGVVADTRAPSGLPLIINNWAPGSTDSEMDLLSWVPVTHRFRAPAPPAPR
ncbi:MAG TPA: DUF1287 domain-containing protein [Polyangia bacterium]|jgi:hypothetical protein|nr:DUF1287 domain-containing protein [Polyangia bacterium]